MGEGCVGNVVVLFQMWLGVTWVVLVGVVGCV